MKWIKTFARWILFRRPKPAFVSYIYCGLLEGNHEYLVSFKVKGRIVTRVVKFHAGRNPTPKPDDKLRAYFASEAHILYG